MVNGKSLYVSGQVVAFTGLPRDTGVGIRPGGNCGRKQPAASRTHCISGGLYYCCKWKSGHEKEELMERINQYGEQPVVLTLWRGARADSGIGGAG